MGKNYSKCRIPHTFIMGYFQNAGDYVFRQGIHVPSRSTRYPPCVFFCEQFQNYKITDNMGAHNGIKIIPENIPCAHIPGEMCIGGAYYNVKEHVFLPKLQSRMGALMRMFEKELQDPECGAETPRWRKLEMLPAVLKEWKAKINGNRE